MIPTPSRVKRSREALEVQVISKQPRIQDEMKKEEGGVEDEEEEAEIEVLDFDDYNEVPVNEAASQKATRSDDAGIQVHWWDDRIERKLTKHWSKRENLKERQQQNYGRNFEAPVEKFKLKRDLRVLREFALLSWKCLLQEDFVSWYEKEGQGQEEWLEIRVVGEASVARALKASWWEWDYGSFLFFWRLPADYQDTACKGVIPMFLRPPPQCKESQPIYRNTELKAKVKAKLEKVMKKGYIKIADIQMAESIMYARGGVVLKRKKEWWKKRKRQGLRF